MKRFLMAAALTCVLSCTALGGDIPSVGFTAPPPVETAAPTAPGEVPSGGLTQQMSEAALDLFQMVFGVAL